MDFESSDDAQQKLDSVGYISSKDIATVVFLADRLRKPVLIEGPAGVGKTELAKAWAKSLNLPLVRLQCYEGLDESKSLYEWEYGKQLLYTQLLKEKLGELLADAENISDAATKLSKADAVFFSERFLLPRPLLQVLTTDQPSLLLIDEIDKSDPEFEAFLLELLSDFAVTIPELGTIQAKHTPRVVLTSNAMRELSDALKRRCLHLTIDFPTAEQELAIVRRSVPGIEQSLSEQVVRAVQSIRQLELKKLPSIAETIDWARSLVVLNAATLDSKLIESTLNFVLKYQTDIAKARDHLSFIAKSATTTS